MTWCRRGKSEKVQKGLVFPKHRLGIQKLRTQMKKFQQIDSLEVPKTYYQNVLHKFIYFMFEQYSPMNKNSPLK